MNSLQCTTFWTYVVIASTTGNLNAQRSPTERLKVVPGIDNIEQLYLEIRKNNGKSYDQPEMIKDQKIKKEIYMNIFTTHLLNDDIKPVNLDSPSGVYRLNRERMKEYESGMKYSVVPFRSKYLYPSKTRNVYVRSTKQSFLENMFFCFVETYFRTRMEELIAYWVSDEYNTNSIPGHYTAGRFIFYLLKGDANSQDDKMIVHHLAEEPARVIEDSQTKLEERYLKAFKNRSIAKNEADDPICGLSPVQRLQVCSSVMYSSYFDGKFEHFHFRIVMNCAKINVSFEFNHDEFNPYTVYEEWLLWCPVDIIGDQIKTYSVSVGATRDDVFVYKEVRDENGVSRYYLANLSTNVRNVTRGVGSPSSSADRDVPVSNEEEAVVHNDEDETSVLEAKKEVSH